MERKYIVESLKAIGYSEDGINSIMSRRRRPRIESQYDLKDKYGIPLEAWRDIKSFISTSSHKQAS